MKIIIGLGNPGKKYEFTRHNAGFMLVDKLKEVRSFPNFELNKKFDAEVSEKGVKCQMSNVKCLLVRPQAFMNNSGVSVKKILDFYKLTPADILVIHDDLDIELGKYKIAADSSSAGHQGVQNIIDNLGTQKFTRIRIGVEGEEKRKNRLMSSDEFVLQKFSEEELAVIKEISDDILKEIDLIL